MNAIDDIYHAALKDDNPVIQRTFECCEFFVKTINERINIKCPV